VTGDPMKLVKFICTATAHASGRSDAALTIHDGVWAFCPAGAEANSHQWAPSDGLPIADAMRFTPRQQAPTTARDTIVPDLSPPAPASAKGKARTR
jgi:hypothetical protein